MRYTYGEGGVSTSINIRYCPFLMGKISCLDCRSSVTLITALNHHACESAATPREGAHFKDFASCNKSLMAIEPNMISGKVFPPSAARRRQERSLRATPRRLLYVSSSRKHISTKCHFFGRGERSKNSTRPGNLLFLSLLLLSTRLISLHYSFPVSVATFFASNLLHFSQRRWIPISHKWKRSLTYTRRSSQ